MKNHLYLLLLLVSISTGYSQSEVYQTIRGTVIDQQSKHPIIGATVQLMHENTLIGTATDLDGTFTLLKVPVGRNTLIVSYIGYAEAVLSNVLVNSGKETILTIPIKEQVTQLNEVVVRANQKKPINSMSIGSARVLSIEEMSRFSGGFLDPARMAQNYAGVAGARDDRNDIIVRGNSPSGVLWRLEGIDIPSPNHWSVLGTTGGPVSMLNANNLSNSDFLSSAFPAEYSNATAAVFDLKLRNGNAEKYEFLGQIGFNGFDVFKINMPTTKSGTFSLWGLGGVSDISFSSGGGSIYAQGAGRLNSGSKTGITGLSHLYFFNENTSSKFTLSLSNTNSTTTLASVGALDSIFKTTYSSNYKQTKYGLNWAINKKWNAKNRLKTGIQFDVYDMSTIDSVLINNSFWFKQTDFEGNLSLARAYAQWQHRFTEQLTMNVGVNNSFLFFNNSYTLEPRFGLDYQLNAKNSLSFGYGRHSQLQPLPVYFSKDRNASEAENKANEALDFIKSDHLVLSWNHAIRPSLRMKLEAYYQQLSSLAVDNTPSSFSLVNSGANFDFPNRVGLVNDGGGTNKGLELTLEKSLDKGYYLLFTGSLFDSQYEGSDQIKRNTFFNTNYVANLLGGKEFQFSDKWLLSLDARVTYAGGRRYTPIDLEQSIAQGREIKDRSRLWEAQYDPYFRADFKIGVRNNQPKFSQIWSIDLTNLTFRRNIFGQSFNAERGRITNSYQRGFFPNVLYQIVF